MAIYLFLQLLRFSKKKTIKNCQDDIKQFLPMFFIFKKLQM